VLLTFLTVVSGEISRAGALSEGPNSPALVVDDPSTGTLAWSVPQNGAISDDFPTVTGGMGASHYLKATGFGFAIPSGAVINGIQIDLERRGVVVSDGALRIVKDGIIGATDRSQPFFTDWNTVVDVVVTYGGSGDLWGETWNAADINAGDFGFALSVIMPDGIALVDAISITVFYSADCTGAPAGTPCGDLTVCNGAETCDGTGTCQPGSPLDCDDNSLCTEDSCDPLDGCAYASAPVGGCRSALKSKLILKDKATNSSDKLTWIWAKGQSTIQSELGAPNATTQYSLCIYTGTTGSLVADYTVDADAMKWSAIGTTGYKYKDTSASADGITKVILRGNTNDKAKCVVKGKGDGLDDLDLTELVDPVKVQLVNDTTSVCFESAFDQSDFIHFNDPAEFKAKVR
jgi:hypothetical protein